MSTDNVKSEEKSLSSTELGPRTFFGVWRDWILAALKYIWKRFHSPMGIYLFATWLISVTIMGITNTLRGESFLEGPYYWVSVFLTFGLNSGQDPSSRIIAKPVLVWFFAPMVVLILGFCLFMLGDSGYFRNGYDLVAEQNFAQNHRFYSLENIWGSNLPLNKSGELAFPNNPKYTLAYFLIVIMPIVLGAVVAGTYNFIVFKIVQKRPKFLPKTRTFLVIMFLASLVVGVSVALMTGNISLDFREFFYSLFVDRRSNTFLVYGFEFQECCGEQGQYHPIGVSFTAWLLYMIPFLLVYGIFLLIGNLDTIWRNKDYFYRKITGAIDARRTPDMDFDEKA